ncbi:hypothetical protein [Tuberibacillus sp. Marseille-P3662]|uniref:hypothetical protein n=1 Tax=Tuberibacillus sp. Marseille-P3662 TaxID=1965358 RepID=UPI000A1C9EB9|nr:hypothetical protein [Tuberibacillus sp. Marseille-P3662]
MIMFQSILVNVTLFLWTVFAAVTCHALVNAGGALVAVLLFVSWFTLVIATKMYEFNHGKADVEEHKRKHHK